MVAYSFRPMFVCPIRSLIKRQTIRADRKRHARPGEQLQLYTGMRTKHCRIIGRALCVDVTPIRIFINLDRIDLGGQPMQEPAELQTFALLDGFTDWQAMKAFWRCEHPKTSVFSGVVIRWTGLTAGG